MQYLNITQQPTIGTTSTPRIHQVDELISVWFLIQILIRQLFSEDIMVLEVVTEAEADTATEHTHTTQATTHGMR